MKKHFLLSIFFLALAINQTFAQQLLGGFTYHGFLDNREYARSGRFSQTIFGHRLAPTIGLGIDSNHVFKIGLNALHEFGAKDKNFIKNVSPILYYQFKNDKTDFFFGAFPRQNLLSDYPRLLLNDTLNYFRPNLEGMLVKFKGKKLSETIWIDWTSRQSDRDRETFLFGLSGNFRAKKFFVNHYAYMFHNAKARITFPGDFVEDNGGAMLEMGLDFAKSTIFDSLTTSVGMSLSLERVRLLSSSFETPVGFISNTFLGYKKWSIKNSFYKGDGHRLINGDKFYTAKTYNRLDIGFMPLKYKNLEGQFVFTYHFLPGVTDNQQAFFLRYSLSGSKNL